MLLMNLDDMYIAYNQDVMNRVKSLALQRFFQPILILPLRIRICGSTGSLRS